MLFDVSTLSHAARYHALIQTVIPRPIAWTLTDNGIGEGVGRYNLAPFSFFNAVAATPPLLMISIDKKEDGGEKDTLANLRKRGLLTVHITSEASLENMVDSSVDLPHGASELLRRPYKLEEGPEGFLPRLAEANIAFFCRLDHIHPLPESATTTVFCRIHHLYVNDKVTAASDRLTVDPLKVLPVSRLGGSLYSVASTTRSLQRPKS